MDYAWDDRASSRRARRSSTSRRAAAAESASRRATSCAEAGQMRPHQRLPLGRGRARSCAQTAAAVIGASRGADATRRRAPGRRTAMRFPSTVTRTDVEPRAGR